MVASAEVDLHDLVDVHQDVSEVPELLDKALHTDDHVRVAHLHQTLEIAHDGVELSEVVPHEGSVLGVEGIVHEYQAFVVIEGGTDSEPHLELALLRVVAAGGDVVVHSGGVGNEGSSGVTVLGSALQGGHADRHLLGVVVSRGDGDLVVDGSRQIPAAAVRGKVGVIGLDEGSRPEEDESAQRVGVSEGEHTVALLVAPLGEDCVTVGHTVGLGVHDVVDDGGLGARGDDVLHTRIVARGDLPDVSVDGGHLVSRSSDDEVLVFADIGTVLVDDGDVRAGGDDVLHPRIGA